MPPTSAFSKRKTEVYGVLLYRFVRVTGQGVMAGPEPQPESQNSLTPSLLYGRPEKSAPEKGNV